MFSELLFREHRFAPLERSFAMSAVDKLISYISTLTPEQIEKLVNQLPRLTALLSEQVPPYPRGQTSQNQ